MANPRAGKVLQGRYRLRSVLAEGGMGVVWMAERVGIERPVVIKFLQAVFSDRPGAVDRFEREARATARLNHPNCVQLVDFGLDDQKPYLVVEFVEGQTLAELLDHGPLDARRAARIAVQTLAGLEHAHERGILHRDLKPANLMIIEAIGYTDFVKILDFGLAKIIGEADKREVTVHGVALGTPGYMSPEQAAGMPSDLRADIYSVGAVLYHLVTGVKVFEGANVHSILRKHREDTPAPPRSLRGPGAISAELDAVVSKAMQRDPDKRFQTATDMRRALEATPEGAPTGQLGSRPVPPKARAGAPIGEDDDNETRVAGALRRRAVVPPPAKQRSMLPIYIAVGSIMALTGIGLATWKLRGLAEVVDRPPIVESTTTVVEAKPVPPQPVVRVLAQDLGTPDLASPLLGDPPDEANDGSDEDTREPPPPPPEAPHREARDVRTLADVKLLVRKGETDLALSGLYQLRRKGALPRDKQAELATLLGHLYFDRHWSVDALREYRYALGLDVRARTDATIINNTVKALGDRATAARAKRVLIDFVGRSAIPALRAAEEHPETRARAEDVLTKLGAPRR